MEPPSKRQKRSHSRVKRDSFSPDTPRTEHLETVSKLPRKTPQRYSSGLEEPSQGEHPHGLSPISSAHLKRFPNHPIPDFSSLTRRLCAQGYVPIQNPPPAVTGEELGLQHVEDPYTSQTSVAPLPTSSNLGRLPWPQISFGDRAPQPRWLVTKENRAGGRWTLVWTFDAGASSGWNQLNQDQLYEYAYKCLEDALDDPMSREQLRLTVTSTGPVAGSVSHIQDPLPPLPPVPQTTYLDLQPGLHEIMEAPTKLEHATYYFPNYDRPSMAVRPGLYTRPSNLHVMAAKMFRHVKGSLVPPCDQGVGDALSSSMDDDKSQSSSGMQSSRAQEQYELERMQDIPTSGRLSPLPPEDGGKIARIGSEAIVKKDPQRDDNQQLPSAVDPPSNYDPSNPIDEHFGLFSAGQVEKYYPKKGPAMGGPTEEQLEEQLADRFMSRWARSVQHYQPNKEAQEILEEMRVHSRRDGKDEFLAECLKISHDPMKRGTYFSKFGPVRRIRSWAGSSEVPAAVTAKLRGRVSRGPSSDRPFRPSQAHGVSRVESSVWRRMGDMVLTGSRRPSKQASSSSSSGGRSSGLGRRRERRRTVTNRAMKRFNID